MTDLEQIIKYSLHMFNVSVAIQINDKVVILHPSVLRSIDINDIAKSLTDSSLTDDEIIKGLEIIDEARNTTISDNNERTKT